MLVGSLNLPDLTTNETVVLGYLGDGQGDVPPGSLHRADGLPHVRPHHPGHHGGEVGLSHNGSLIFSFILLCFSRQLRIKAGELERIMLIIVTTVNT